MKHTLWMSGAALLVAAGSAFAAGADRAPIRLTDAQMARIVGGSKSVLVCPTPTTCAWWNGDRATGKPYNPKTP
jgi:hypothetical protein